jgi:membrane protein DedA with SNARE-associated domain
VSDILAWLTSLPDALLYGAILFAAFLEYVFPPLPADTVIALGAFVAARGNGTEVGVWTATMVGNVGGAMLMYALGHRYGLPWLMQRFPSVVSAGAADRFATRFKTQGLLAVIVSRFLPAVRALVPPMAGALGVGAVRAAVAMTLASGVWYGIVCGLAFRAGANADALLVRIGEQQRLLAAAAAVVVVLASGVIIWRVRASRTKDAPP